MVGQNSAWPSDEQARRGCEGSSHGRQNIHVVQWSEDAEHRLRVRSRGNVNEVTVRAEACAQSICFQHLAFPKRTGS